MIGWKTTLPVYVLKSLHTEQCDKSVCKRLLKEITNQSYHDKHRMTAIDHTDRVCFLVNLMAESGHIVLQAMNWILLSQLKYQYSMLKQQKTNKHINETEEFQCYFKSKTRNNIGTFKQNLHIQSTNTLEY